MDLAFLAGLTVTLTFCFSITEGTTEEALVSSVVAVLGVFSLPSNGVNSLRADVETPADTNVLLQQHATLNTLKN